MAGSPRDSVRLFLFFGAFEDFGRFLDALAFHKLVIAPFVVHFHDAEHLGKRERIEGVARVLFRVGVSIRGRIVAAGVQAIRTDVEEVFRPAVVKRYEAALVLDRKSVV